MTQPPEKLLPRVAPYPLPDKSDCYFYHSLDLPNGEVVEGDWDIRGRFQQYVAGYPLKGKTVLDMGTATGFLAFCAEAEGATVTGLEIRSAADFERVPFVNSAYHIDRAAWNSERDALWEKVKRGFWYGWHKLGSKATVSYVPINELQYYDEMFDVVLAGAIIEHLADPVSSINAMCRKAREAVIIGFTPVERDPRLMMLPMNPWVDREIDYVWWKLSEGLYARIFANLGFEIELRPATATFVGEKREEERFTIVARRKSPVGGDPLPLQPSAYSEPTWLGRLFGVGR